MMCSYPGPEVVKLVSRSVQLSTKFQLLIKGKMVENKIFLALKLPGAVFILLIMLKCQQLLA